MYAMCQAVSEQLVYQAFFWTLTLNYELWSSYSIAYLGSSQIINPIMMVLTSYIVAYSITQLFYKIIKQQTFMRSHTHV